MARKKMWWQDPNPVIEPWVINLHREPCDCSQGFRLALTGLSAKQGPTHYCPGCRWAFWPVEKKPSADQVKLAKKDHPDITEKDMTYTKLCNKPTGKWGSTAKTMMIDQLGTGKQFLTAELQFYWSKKYCEKYPNSDYAKAWSKRNLPKKQDK